MGMKDRLCLICRRYGPPHDGSPCGACGSCVDVSEDWPTRPVELNHLEAMGICMSLMAEDEREGLSEPQRDALNKVQAVLSNLLDDLGRPQTPLRGQSE